MGRCQQTFENKKFVALFCHITSSKLSRQEFEFSMKMKVMESNPGHLPKSFLLYFLLCSGIFVFFLAGLGQKLNVLLQCSVPELDLHCQYILSNSQQACTIFMQTYLYLLISTRFFILATNLPQLISDAHNSAFQNSALA